MKNLPLITLTVFLTFTFASAGFAEETKAKEETPEATKESAETASKNNDSSAKQDVSATEQQAVKSEPAQEHSAMEKSEEAGATTPQVTQTAETESPQSVTGGAGREATESPSKE